MNFNWHAIKDNIDPISKVVVTLAVVIGGGWAVYTFNGELKRENASAQLTKINHEVAATKQIAYEIELTASAMPSFGNERLIQVEVSIRNKGLRDFTIPLKAKSLRLSPITTPDYPAQPELETRSMITPVPVATDESGRPVTITSMKIATGTEAKLLYLAQIDAPGRYLIEFSVPSRAIDPPGDGNSELSASRVLTVLPEVSAPRGAKPPLPADRRKHGD
jgi:hypothetical protein